MPGALDGEAGRETEENAVRGRGGLGQERPGMTDGGRRDRQVEPDERRLKPVRWLVPACV